MSQRQKPEERRAGTVGERAANKLPICTRRLSTKCSYPAIVMRNISCPDNLWAVELPRKRKITINQKVLLQNDAPALGPSRPIRDEIAPDRANQI
jgi:hypothetical protein